MNTQDIIDLEKRYILQTYVRPDFVLDRGEGMLLWDTDGKEYLDFVSGLSVNALGYRHDGILEAMRAQAAKLIHVSNLYHTSPAPQLARRLCESCFADRAFFCNSGTESWEAALKFARKWGHQTFPDKPKSKFVAMNHSFHGRTLGAISTTGQPKYHKGFAPLLPGISFADLNDLESVERLVDAETAAVLVEPLQAEGGIHPADAGFLKGLRQLCDEMKMLLVFDEIQCGLGRTGTLYCHQHSGVEPDIMTLAKPLAGGLPIGVTLMRQHVADAVSPGDHAATFGAHPVSCAVGLEVFRTISDPAFLAAVQANGAYLRSRLEDLMSRFPERVSGIRGQGLIVGAVMRETPAGDVVTAFRERGILVCVAGPDVVRFLPPLIVEQSHIDKVTAAFEDILAA